MSNPKQLKGLQQGHPVSLGLAIGLLSAKKHLCGFHLQCQIQSSNGPSKGNQDLSWHPIGLLSEKKHLCGFHLQCPNPKQQWPPARATKSLLASHRLAQRKKASLWLPLAVSNPKQQWPPARSPSLLLASPRLAQRKKSIFVASTCSVKFKAARPPARATKSSLGLASACSAQKKHLCGFHLQCQIQSSNGLEQGHQAFSWPRLGLLSAKKASLWLPLAVSNPKQQWPPARSSSLLLASHRLAQRKKASLWLPLAVSNPKQQWPPARSPVFSWPRIGLLSAKKASLWLPLAVSNPKQQWPPARSSSLLLASPRLAQRKKSIFVASTCSVKSKAAMASSKVIQSSLGLPSACSAKKSIFVASTCSVKSKAAMASSKVIQSSLGLAIGLLSAKKASLWLPLAVSNPKQQWPPARSSSLLLASPRLAQRKKSIFVASTCSVKSKAAMASSKVIQSSLGLASACSAQKKHLCGFHLQCQIQSSNGLQQGHPVIASALAQRLAQRKKHLCGFHQKKQWLPLAVSNPKQQWPPARSSSLLLASPRLAQRKKSIFVASTCSVKSKAAMASSKGNQDLSWPRLGLLSGKKASLWLPLAVSNPKQQWPPARSSSLLLAAPRLAQRKKSIFVASTCSAKFKSAKASSKVVQISLGSPLGLLSAKKASLWLPLAVSNPKQQWPPARSSSLLLASPQLAQRKKSIFVASI